MPAKCGDRQDFPKTAMVHVLRVFCTQRVARADASRRRAKSGGRLARFSDGSARSVSMARSRNARTFCVACRPSRCTTWIGSAGGSNSASTICERAVAQMLRDLVRQQPRDAEVRGAAAIAESLVVVVRRGCRRTRTCRSPSCSRHSGGGRDAARRGSIVCSARSSGRRGTPCRFEIVGRRAQHAPHAADGDRLQRRIWAARRCAPPRRCPHRRDSPRGR